MAIIAATVESNGWVLRLDCTGSLTAPATNFGAYALSPDAAPRVVLGVSSPGFVRSGGTAVAGIQARQIIATNVLRLPIDPTNPNVKLLDETSLGGGVIRVRIALSEEVYATDTVGTLGAAAGWRAGEDAASGIAVANTSALAAPQPVFRWALPPYEVTSGVFRVSLIVGTVHPMGFEPAAGVRFTATDGTTTKTVWATALATDNSYGDNLRCYSVEIDPATATALTAGLLRVDAEVYPFVGPMRSTDPAGTRVMTSLRTDGFLMTAEAPYVIGYDPAGSRYSARFAYVDPVNGITAANVGMIATTLAEAKAIAPGARARNISTAISAAALQNVALAAANGQAAATRSVDGVRVVLAPGTHTGVGATSVSSTATGLEIPVVVEGDPEDSNPRANCIISTPTAASVNLRATRMRWRNLTVLAGNFSLTTSTAIYNLIDNIQVVGKPGSETVTTAPITSGAAPAGQINSHMTNCRVWRTGFNIGGANRQVGLLRRCEFSRRATGFAFLKNRWISRTEDGFTASNTTEGIGTIVQTTALGGFEDVVSAYNDFRALIGTAHSFAPAPTGLTGSTLTRSRRHLVLNNVFERISGTAGVSGTSTTMLGYGESQLTEMDTLIVEGNTIAGSASNMYYNEPVPVTLADINTQNSLARRIRHANNATDRNASKHDDFSDPTAANIRTANGINGLAGWRPVLTGAWSVHFGVGMEGHVDCSRKGTIPNFFREFSGLRGVQYGVATDPGYVDDRSEAGNDLGGGDYTPAAGSVLRNRITRANSDRDFAGAARLANGAAGAFEAPAAGLPLTPAAGRSGHVAAASAVAISFGIAAVSAWHGHGAAASAVGWSADLGPAPAVSASRAADSGIIDTLAATSLAPAGALHALAATSIILFPDGVFAAGGTLSVPADRRTLAILQPQNEEIPDAQSRQ